MYLPRGARFLGVNRDTSDDTMRLAGSLAALPALVEIT